jgi:hypothetical protein
VFRVEKRTVQRRTDRARGKRGERPQYSRLLHADLSRSRASREAACAARILTDASARLGALEFAAQFTQFAQQCFDIDLVFQIDLKIGVGARAILARLPILAHHDQRTL